MGVDDLRNRLGEESFALMLRRKAALPFLLAENLGEDGFPKEQVASKLGVLLRVDVQGRRGTVLIRGSVDERFSFAGQVVNPKAPHSPIAVADVLIDEWLEREANQVEPFDTVDLVDPSQTTLARATLLTASKDREADLTDLNRQHGRVWTETKARMVNLGTADNPNIVFYQAVPPEYIHVLEHRTVADSKSLPYPTMNHYDVYWKPEEGTNFKVVPLPQHADLRGEEMVPLEEAFTPAKIQELMSLVTR